MRMDSSKAKTNFTAVVLLVALFLIPVVVGNSAIRTGFVNLFSNSRGNVKLEPIVAPVSNAEETAGVLGTGTGSVATCSSASGLGPAGSFTCVEASADVDVTDGSTVDGNVVRFSQDCSIEPVVVTYPAYIDGYNSDDDPDIDVRKGEWPDLENLLTSVQPTAKFENGESYMTNESTCNCQHVPIGQECSCNDGSGGTQYDYSIGPKDKGSASEGEIVTPCSNGSAISQTGCAGAGKAVDAADGNQYGGEPIADIFTAPGGYETRFNEVLKGTEGPSWVCTSGEEAVPFKVGCIGSPSFRLVNFEGIISDITCLVDSGSCTTTSSIIVSIMNPGRNEIQLTVGGAEDRQKSLDKAVDAFRMYQTPPSETIGMTEQVLSIARNQLPVSHDWPYSVDKYVEVPIKVMICGRPVILPGLFKDYWEDYYYSHQNSVGTCNPDTEVCDFETWWNDYVQNPAYNGGAPANSLH